MSKVKMRTGPFASGVVKTDDGEASANVDREQLADDGYLQKQKVWLLLILYKMMMGLMKKSVLMIFLLLLLRMKVQRQDQV